jgi:hypothetical protein
MEKDKYVKNDNLKNEANKLFKGLIKNAYVEVEQDWKLGYTSNNIIEASLKDCVDNKGDIHYDSESIALEFTNGTILQFWNSEWGGISKFDGEIIDENTRNK